MNLMALLYLYIFLSTFSEKNLRVYTYNSKLKRKSSKPHFHNCVSYFPTKNEHSTKLIMNQMNRVSVFKKKKNVKPQRKRYKPNPSVFPHMRMW